MKAYMACLVVYCDKCSFSLSEQAGEDGNISHYLHLENACENSGKKYAVPEVDLVELKDDAPPSGDNWVGR